MQFSEGGEMSVKAMGLVWDLQCPKQYDDIAFKPSHKYVLIAYADHADHNGKNIYPAIGTIANKTGLDERTVQRLTSDLEKVGLLIDDGQGPRGTNRWSLPYNQGGDKLTPLSFRQGDKSQESLGDIPSGDIPSGDKLTPELNKPEPNNINDSPVERLFSRVLETLKPDLKGNSYVFLSSASPVSFEDNVLTLAVADESTREWLADRLSKTIDRLLPGMVKHEAEVRFVVGEVA
jgi:hypothetical protein